MGEKLSEMKRNLDWLDPQARPRQWLAEHQKKMAGLCKDERKRNGMADPVNGRRAAATRTTLLYPCGLPRMARLGGWMILMQRTNGQRRWIPAQEDDEEDEDEWQGERRGGG
jgi:hypothetical protein